MLEFMLVMELKFLMIAHCFTVYFQHFNRGHSMALFSYWFASFRQMRLPCSPSFYAWQLF